MDGTDKAGAGVVRTATLAVGLTVAALVVAKASRDALFLTTYDVRQLPNLMAAAAVLSLGSALLAGRAFVRLTPARVLPTLFAVSGGMHGIEILLLPRMPTVVAVMLFLHIAAFGATSLAGVWAIVNESFDPHRAKRAVAQIALGGPVGGVAGGLLGLALAYWAGVTAGLSVLVLLSASAAFVAYRMGAAAKGGARPVETKRAPAPSGGYIRDLGALVALIAIAGAIADYWVSARAVEVFSSDATLMSFFSVLHMAVGVLAFLTQATFARTSLEKLGIAGTIGILPGATLALCLAPFLTPALWAVVVLRGATGTLAASLYRAGYELLYTPLPVKQKRAAKLLVDVGLDRIGTALGAGLVSVLLIWAPGDVSLATALATASVLTLVLCVKLHTGYIRALASSLKSGSVTLAGSDVFDSATRRTLAETQGLNRTELLAEIERRRAGQLDSAPPSAMPSVPPPPEMTFDESMIGLPRTVELLRGTTAQEDPVLETLTLLRSGGAADIRAQLEQPIQPEWAPLVIGLLRRKDVARAAVNALRRDAPRYIGQLVDTLLDPDQDEVVRRRVPRVLERTRDERVVAGLVEALFDSSMHVRTQSGLALLELTRRFPDLQLPEERILDSVRRELDRARDAEQSGALQHDPERWGQQDRRRVEQGVEFSMIALSLVFEREPLQLAYKALQGQDATLRGTALEYFETVLPDDIRRRSTGFLHSVAPRAERRPREKLVAELLRSRSA